MSTLGSVLNRGPKHNAMYLDRWATLDLAVTKKQEAAHWYPMLGKCQGSEEDRRRDGMEQGGKVDG